MQAWRAYLKGDPTGWLLEETNPSVRYLTLLNILNRSETDADAILAKKQIMDRGIVPQILKMQQKDCWNDPGRFYVDKYKGTVWQLIILAEHGADGDNPKIKAGCEYILEHSQDPESFGFSIHQRGKNGGGRHSEVIPCLTGNLIWSLIKLGYLKDERIQKGIEWIAKYQRFDDRISKQPAGWPYDRFEICWGKHTCHMGAIKALKALAAIPKEARNKSIERTIEQGSDYFLKHHIYKKSHDLSSVAKPGWLKLQFPLMYQTDILEVTDILLQLGIKDDRMNDTVKQIVSKQDSAGKWKLENTFNEKFHVAIEAKGKPSKWITLRALKVIKNYYA
jgi:hypothetical protein